MNRELLNEAIFMTAVCAVAVIVAKFIHVLFNIDTELFSFNVFHIFLFGLSYMASRMWIMKNKH